jgi:glucose/arabinose dehydrogenase
MNGPRRLLVAPACVLSLVAATHALDTSSAGAHAPASPAARDADAAAAPNPPAGFTDTVVGEVSAPTALAFTPDGRMLVTSKPGRVVVVREDGARQVALDISARVCDQVERGLVGIAVDPEFASNRSFYVYYTHKVRGSCGERGPAPANRVSRFVLGDDDTVARRSEKVLMDHITSPAGNHIAGDLEFGENGNLYVTVGDGVCSVRRPSACGPVNDNSQLTNVPQGKVLRVTRNGRPAPGNPFLDAAGARRCTRPAGVPAGAGPCKEVYALGFRNPFRFARRPGTNAFFVNDVGLHTWEEVDRLRKGRNYGWNAREGHCARDSTTQCTRVRRFTDPIYDYRHGDCRSVTGGAFVPRGVWPGYDGAYLFSDFGCGKIFRLERRAEGGWKRTTFLSGARGPVHLRFGPSSGGGTALHYLSYFTNTVHRIALTGRNSPPVAQFSYTPDGRTLRFSARRSTDPDGDRLTSWRWSFGDGTSAVTDRPRVTHTYPEDGTFEASLVVTDVRGARSAPATAAVHSGEHPPTLTLTSPNPEARFPVGRTLTLSVQAQDPEDGPLPGSAVTWEVRLRHGNHFHPFLGPVEGNEVTLTYPSPEDLQAAASSRLVALATATDSRGHTTRLRHVLLPRTVDLTFRTSPAGGHVVLQGDRHRTPVTVTSWARYPFVVTAPDQQIDGRRRVFQEWSDGGARRHQIVSPRRATSYTATFR